MLVRHKVWNLPHGLPIVALLLLLSRDLISHPAQQRMTRRKRMQRKRTSCAQLPTKLRSSPKNDSCNGGRLYDYEWNNVKYGIQTSYIISEKLFSSYVGRWRNWAHVSWTAQSPKAKIQTNRISHCVEKEQFHPFKRINPNREFIGFNLYFCPVIKDFAILLMQHQSK